MSLVCVLLVPCFLWVCAAHVGAAEEKKQEKKEEEKKEEEKRTICTLFLGNDDHLEGDLLEIADGEVSLVFHPTEATKKLIKVELEKTRLIDFGNERSFREDWRRERLRLRDGSLLYGKFIKLTEKSIHFDFEDTGPVELPRSEVAELVRGSAEPRRGSRGAKHHVVVTTRGNVMSGDLSHGGDGLLTIARKDFKTTVHIKYIASILFPAADATAPEDKRLRSAVNTRRGSLISGTEPSFKDGRLALTTLGGRRVSLPVEEIVDVSFGTGDVRVPRRSVLVWGLNSDREDEFRSTINVIRKHLPAWRVVEDFSDLGDDFKKELARSSVLLVPEMEVWRGSAALFAPKFKNVAEDFLRRGGRVVFLGVNNHGTLGFLRNAGLADLVFVEYNMNPDSQGATVPFTDAGRMIAQGVGSSFVTANSTYFFGITGKIKVTAWAQSSSGTPIVARKIGLEWLIIMGMDYHEHNEQTERMLINALTQR